MMPALLVIVFSLKVQFHFSLQVCHLRILVSTSSTKHFRFPHILLEILPAPVPSSLSRNMPPEFSKPPPPFPFFPILSIQPSLKIQKRGVKKTSYISGRPLNCVEALYSGAHLRRQNEEQTPGWRTEEGTHQTTERALAVCSALMSEIRPSR